MILIYVFVNETEPPPSYMYTSIYQTCTISDIPIVILVNKQHIDIVQKTIDTININTTNTNTTNTNTTNTNTNEISITSVSVVDHGFVNSTFRNNFWRHTTERFFVIERYLKENGIVDSFVHIENDVLLYCDPQQLKFSKGLYFVKDSNDRGIGSIMFSTPESWSKFTKYASSNLHKNDMEILGSYIDTDVFTLPNDPKSAHKLLFDGAAFGQFIAGIDPRNTTNQSLYNNNTSGFINETSVVNPSDYRVIRKLVNVNGKELFKYYIKHGIKCLEMFNLHIHSKHPSPYTSTFDIQHSDIITGDRVLGLCDLVFCTRPIYNYHTFIHKNCKNVIIVNDFSSVNEQALFKFVRDVKKYTIKIHVYTHILEPFVQYILPLLESAVNQKYIFYIHNA